MAIKKYRPYLTLSELRLLQSSLEETPQKHKGHKILSRYLQKYISDIESGYRSSNHTLKPSLEEQLGIRESDPDETIEAELERAQIELERKFQ
jgi:hypothetical protein